MKSLYAVLWVLLSHAMLLMALPAVAGPYNIAPQASVKASTELNDQMQARHVTDGITGVIGMGDWACQGQTTVWGFIRYPWIQLDWDEPVSIEKVLLYDRAIPEEHTAGGILHFSDGSKIYVYSIPNDGTAKSVEFPAKRVEWIRFEVTDGEGKHLGLSEIEVFPSPESYADPLSYVNPFIETTRGRYFYFTPAAHPMGMIAPAPHTRNKNQWGGGYNYNSMHILGFGQIHAWMLAGLEIMPVTGEVDPRGWQDAWKSSFSHEDEIAQPGYYRVFLRDYKTWVEISSTDRVAFYRFRYTRDAEARILTNLGGYIGSCTMVDAQVNKVSEREFEGSFVTTGRFWGGPERVKVFFVATFDQASRGFHAWQDDQLMENIEVLREESELSYRDSSLHDGVLYGYKDAPTAGVFNSFNVKAGDTLQMKLAISYTSIDNARKNLEAECDHWQFDQVRQTSQDIWNERLGRIKVEGGSKQQQVKFYTDLWHALLGRRKSNDVSGDYPDYTQGERYASWTKASLNVRRLKKNDEGEVIHHMYNSDGIWLTQWNLNILWGLAWPEVMDDFAASFVQQADNGYKLPRGPCAGGYSYIMTGCPATNLLVSAYQKGILTKVDPEHTYEVIKRNHFPGGMMGEEEELRFYMDRGWCPGNAGKTIEWAFQDWSLAQMAEKMGKKRDARRFTKRAEGWKALYQADEQLLFPKQKNGEWLHLNALSMDGWVEANAWQATWAVSHDIAGLADLMGGMNALCEKLNQAFEKAADKDFVFGYGDGYVSYANQPGCSNAHVFNHAGQPWLSQYWVRRVNEQAYGAVAPDRGYGGHDEDEGQMGGVSALMSLGLFSIRGNNDTRPIYEITSPVFDKISIQLNQDYYEGEAFIIQTYNNSDENHYIQKAALNGEPLNNCWFYHEDFAKGGKLELWLGPQPNKNWGIETLPGQ